MNFTDKQKCASTYLVVLSDPNCLAGEAEIQGFHLEAAEGADKPLQIRTCFFGRRADDDTGKSKNKTNQNKTSVNKLTVPDLAFGARGVARLGIVVT